MFLDGMIRKMPGGEGFPWTVPLIANLQTLKLTTAVTFLVGENGCGKSTLLEGMAWGSDAIAVGSHHLETDPTLGSARLFHRAFTFPRTARAYTRLFLRAEDVFGFTNRIAADMAGLREEAAELAARSRLAWAGTTRSPWRSARRASSPGSMARTRMPVPMVRPSCACCRRG